MMTVYTRAYSKYTCIYVDDHVHCPQPIAYDYFAVEGWLSSIPSEYTNMTLYTHA